MTTPEKTSLKIMGHLDMDAFFAAVEERNNPRFKGLPIAVGGDPREGTGRGVLSTANYKAREYGLHSAMSVKKAWQLSEQARLQGKPPVIFLSGGFSSYGKVSSNIMKIIKHHAPSMQKRSVDEAYFDLTHTGSYKSAETLCRTIKKEILSNESLTASIGIGPNKLIAKIASDFNKPNGFTVIKDNEVLNFLAPLTIRTIPGIGPKTAEVLYRQKIKSISDLQKFSEVELHELLGKWGSALYYKAQGIDHSPITESRIAKSIGRNRTLGFDTLDSNILITKLNEACQDIHARLNNKGFKQFKTIVLTVRFFDFHTQTRSHTLKHPANSLPKLQHEILKLFLPFLDHRENPLRKPIRLIGARLEKIT